MIPLLDVGMGVLRQVGPRCADKCGVLKSQSLGMFRKRRTVGDRVDCNRGLLLDTPTVGA